jgi:hypothetical protein
MPVLFLAVDIADKTLDPGRELMSYDYDEAAAELKIAHPEAGVSHDEIVEALRENDALEILRST